MSTLGRDTIFSKWPMHVTKTFVGKDPSKLQDRAIDFYLKENQNFIMWFQSPHYKTTFKTHYLSNLVSNQRDISTPYVAIKWEDYKNTSFSNYVYTWSQISSCTSTKRTNWMQKQMWQTWRDWQHCIKQGHSSP